MIRTPDQQRQRMAQLLYEKHALPLEASHHGQFIAIAESGQYVVAATLRDAVRESAITLGPGSYVFKIGERSVGRWR